MYANFGLNGYQIQRLKKLKFHKQSTIPAGIVLCYSGESAQDFTNRILSEKYGKGNYRKGADSEYSKIKKWAHRTLGLK